MRTQVQDTSIGTFRAMQSMGEFNRQQLIVLASVKPGRDYSLQELSKLTKLPINAVSGRVNELKRKGALEVGPKRPCCVTGSLIAPVRMPSEQMELVL